MKRSQLKELVLQSLEHERGGVLVYQTALECVVNKDLRKEWETYLEQTQDHVVRLTRACTELGFDPDETTAGCAVVHHLGGALVTAMQMALATGDAATAELVACDCVVLAEVKDHANWGLIGECVNALKGDTKADALASAYEVIEDQEDEHLYHSKGWGRELWVKSLGLKAVLPPLEEERDVKTATAAARAAKEGQRSRMTN